MKNKKTIIICASVAAVVIVAFVVILLLTLIKKPIKLEKFDANMQVEKTIQIKNRKQINKLNKIISNLSFEQDDISPYLAIKNDVKLTFNDGRFIILQLDSSDYCYYENPNDNTKYNIKMPEGLLDIVKEILK